ncbi:BRCA1-associated ATM activator 1 isoform X2 [Ambystoma mexicanum]|uniref:BRCA1-associated ATM activator 1 isoform X2 n=1 Tax=Ambystoma mexicanum TaxID=8296 RepID=UPI0037E722C0
MDRECMQLLPAVCAVLADPQQPISDDTCLEKLLDWFRNFVKQGSGDLVLLENPCLTELILQGGDHLSAFFGKTLLTSGSWEDASVRSGWIRGVHSLAQHKRALQFLCDTGALDEIFSMQGDPSLFVASAASQLLVHILITSLQLDMQIPLKSGTCDWPTCARGVLAYLENSLSSKTPARVTQSLKSLTAIFGGCNLECTEVIWLQMEDSVGSLVVEKSVYAESALVDLLLSVARSPVFGHPEGTLWTLLTKVLHHFSPLKAGPLALGVLKLPKCPRVVYIQSLSVLLQPLDYVLRASTAHLEYTSLLDELVCDPAAVETLLFSKSSCVALMCQALAHLQELHRLPSLPEEWPHVPLLNAVMAILQFCIGADSISSPAGANISRLLIGSLRVQGLAVDALGSFSCSKIKSDCLPRIFEILLAYFKSPDTSPTVIKKCFQSSLQWLVNLSETEGSADKMPHCERFLTDLLPVLQMRLCSPIWEIRDSALEFITHLARNVNEHDGFQQILLCDQLKELVLDLLKDPVSYVRASAVSTLGQMTIISNSLLQGTESNSDQENIVSEFLEILSKDTESFPRRAVVKVFADWLRQGQVLKLMDADQMVPKLLQVTDLDLDWEVKVNGLELAEVFVEQTLASLSLSECPYAAGLPSRSSILAESLERFCRVGLFPCLFRALCDCDRPVAQKSCRILLNLKVQFCPTGLQSEGPLPSQMHGTDWLENALKERKSSSSGHPGMNAREMSSQESKWLLETLGSLDLDGLQVSLERSSDHIENSPQSLLQDILASAGTLDENGIDCY